MKNMLKRGLSMVLALIMVVGLMPVTAFASVDPSGRPTDLKNKLVLSIYTTEGTFPGEPATHGSSEYISFNSSFAKTSASGQFKSSAESELNSSILGDLVQGAANGSNTVWGVFSAAGLKEKYFLSDASIIQPANEAKIIRAIKTDMKNKSDEEVLDKYEIIWYVIKLQHSPGNYWWSSGTTEWHIDGLIKEKTTQYVSINYYGNGNTTGSAPDGVTNHEAGEPYTILGSNMTKKINGVDVDFLGWSASPDGTGEFYAPGTVIKPEENVSLYAMWDTTTQYTATVNTYLDGVLTDEDEIHGSSRDLYLSTDEEHYYQLTRSGEGVYTTKITGNGKFHLYNKVGSNYEQVGDRQLTIYNQDGSMDVYHYSVTYNTDGGTFETAPENQLYYYGNTVTAIPNVPTKDGFRFVGWKDAEGKVIQPGEEVTASITAPITLTAQWEKTVKVTVNVTINHEGGDGYDQAPEKDHVALTVASRENSDSPYLEVGQTLNLTSTAHSGFQYSVDGNVTKYEGYTLSDMPGGTAEYTVVTSKSGYDTSVTHRRDANGDWIIDVEMTYKPSNFDLNFTVEVDASVPKEYLPTAAIVKVTFWASGKGVWETITQQAGNEPGVRVDIDPATRTGSGSYPVWKYESNSETPYGNRIEVTSFVYPDGTIVPASAVQTDVKWSDNVYTATMDPVTDGKTYGTLGGAYYDATSNSQKGTLNAVITMDLHNVTFDAQGGKVNGQDSQLVENQYKIPAFKDYVPTRDGGYTFGGWYLDPEFKTAAAEGTDLNSDVTLYAKWIEPLTISGTVTISGTYQQNGKTVKVHDIDKATEAVVVLQELRNGTAVEIDSKTVTFGKYDDSGSADYAFAGIPNEGKSYQIHVLVLNYNTTYDNETDGNVEQYKAVFGTDNVADVDAHLDFAPPSYDQTLRVDATQIGNNFRPKNVLSEVMYRDTGDNHAFQRISQHDVEPYGVQISLTNGTGSGKQTIWNWHTDGTLYDYQMNITKVGGVDFDSDSAPYCITYSAANNAATPDVQLVATLIPKTYPVIFKLNAGADPVTGMDDYKLDADETYTDATHAYQKGHTWSFQTEFTAVPQREGYTFKGWMTDVTDVATDESGKVTIDASVCREVVLTAQWEKNNYTVATVSDPEDGGATTGAGTYAHGEQVMVTATPNTGYNFCGWYEGETLVSNNAEYTFTVTSDVTLSASFAKNAYTVTTRYTTGGTTSGDGSYEYGTTATVVATAENGYTFVRWLEDENEVSRDASYSFTVTGDRTLKAEFATAYTITTLASPEGAGTLTGGGAYESMANATVTAAANGGYYFAGWYDEQDKLVTAETSYSLTVKEDRTFTAKFEKKVSYKCDYVYLFGYTDTQIGATGPLLRGELAQMIYRLVKQNTGVGNGGISFSDTTGEWFASGISYMASKGAIDKNKANAYPYVSVTRGETYKMICLGLGFTADSSLSFSEYAAILRNSGFLSGDGAVTAKITRYEFCALFNAILGRSNYELVDANGNQITAETYGYTDLDPSADYYRTMMIATSTFTNGKVDLAKRVQRNTYDYNN